MEVNALVVLQGSKLLVVFIECCTVFIIQEGVEFQSPHDGSRMLLTPEESMAIQNVIGADIIMQLDDVVHVLTTGERVEEAMHRSVRWLDRCIHAHKRTDQQNLFAIIQGGLQPHLREQCIQGLPCPACPVRTMV